MTQSDVRWENWLDTLKAGNDIVIGIQNGERCIRCKIAGRFDLPPNGTTDDLVVAIWKAYFRASLLSRSVDSTADDVCVSVELEALAQALQKVDRDERH